VAVVISLITLSPPVIACIDNDSLTQADKSLLKTQSQRVYSVNCWGYLYNAAADFPTSVFVPMEVYTN
jgi:hypothetical protein